MKKHPVTVCAVVLALYLFQPAHAQRKAVTTDPQLEMQEAELHDYVYGSASTVDSMMERRLVRSFIVLHPDYRVSLLKFKEMIMAGRVEHAEQRLENFSPGLRQSALGKEVAALIQQRQQLQIGGQAPEIIAKTQDGSPFMLSALKGHYVLIDFWASWCGPCRAESPHLVKAYERFKDKGLIMVSFSLDTDSQAWKQASIQDQYNWPQVSDLKAYQSETVKAYMLTYVPKSFLLNPEGTIIAMDLRGEALQKQLETIFP